MSNLSLRLPDSLHAKIRELAERDDVSINQFIATAVAEKAAVLMTMDYLEERAGRADVKAFDRILSRVPDVPPVKGDELLAEDLAMEKTKQRASPARRRAKTKRSSRAPR